MEVFVVMGNDFPDAVFSTKQLAEAHCEKKKGEEQKKGHWNGARIYWRTYQFTIDRQVP